MDIKANDIDYRISAVARLDEYYQEVLAKCNILEKSYLEIMETLSQEQQIQVDDYIALCEELLHRMSQLAYDLGVKDGMTQAGTSI